MAVPGELAGYWAAHQAFGQLPWPRLVLPTAVLAEKGVAVNKAVAESLQTLSRDIQAEPTMRRYATAKIKCYADSYLLSFFLKRIFVDQSTGQVLKEGDTLKMPQLAKTLRQIAQHGVDIFYNGSLGQQLVEDVQRRGGILTKDDLLQYR